MLPKKAKYPCVWVEWVDSECSTGWDKHDHCKIGPALSVGFLVHEDDEMINVAAALDEVNDYSNAVISIPKSSIIKKVEIL